MYVTHLCIHVRVWVKVRVRVRVRVYMVRVREERTIQDIRNLSARIYVPYFS